MIKKRDKILLKLNKKYNSTSEYVSKLESVIQLLDILVMYPDSASPTAQTRFKGTVRLISRESQFKEEHARFSRVLFNYLSDQ